MTVHPLSPADGDDRDRFDDASPIDDEGTPSAGFGALLDVLIDRFDPLTDRIDGLDELIDGLDDSRDRFASFERNHVLAHRAVAPGLLSGLCWLDLEVCQAFHATVFELLEHIGDFDGLIATSAFFVDTGMGRMDAAEAWLFDHPAPPDDDDARAASDAVTDHSLALAAAVGSNPSLTFASTAALRERLLEGVLEHGKPDLVVSDQQIDWLTDLTLRLLAELRHDVVVVGGVRVVAAEPLR